MQQSSLLPLTLGHFTEGLRVVLHARVLDLERLVNLAEEAAPVRVPEKIGKVTVVPLKIDGKYILRLELWSNIKHTLKLVLRSKN